MALSEKQAHTYSPNVLAFYGDSVYETLVRRRVILSGNMSAGKLHELSVAKARASYQAKAADAIMPYLTEEETDILRRGRNAGGISVPKSASPSEYRRATALETLFGYLGIIGRNDRAEELFDKICSLVSETEEDGADYEKRE